MDPKLETSRQSMVNISWS